MLILMIKLMLKILTFELINYIYIYILYKYYTLLMKIFDNHYFKLNSPK